MAQALTYAAQTVEKMKNSKQLILCLLILFSSTTAFGQIKGDGNRQMRAFEFRGIEIIDLHVTVNAEIDLSATEDLQIEVDGNIFEHLTIKMTGNRLVIDQKEWVQPSETIRLVLSAQGLKKIKNTAWGNILIRNMDQTQFKAVMNVGTLALEGDVDHLEVQTNAGRIDASKLTAKTVAATVNENGQIVANASSKITYGGKGYGKLVYLGTPELKAAGSASSELQVVSYEKELEIRESAKSVAYIDVKIKNNSSKRRQIRFRGPVEKPFGYGAPIGAKSVKSETFPVGTRIYQINPLGKDKLLLIIKAENEGQTLKLYADSE